MTPPTRAEILAIAIAEFTRRAGAWKDQIAQATADNRHRTQARVDADRRIWRQIIYIIGGAHTRGHAASITCGLIVWPVAENDPEWPNSRAEWQRIVRVVRATCNAALARAGDDRAIAEKAAALIHLRRFLSDDARRAKAERVRRYLNRRAQRPGAQPQQRERKAA